MRKIFKTITLFFMLLTLITSTNLIKAHASTIAIPSFNKVFAYNSTTSSFRYKNKSFFIYNQDNYYKCDIYTGDNLTSSKVFKDISRVYQISNDKIALISLNQSIQILSLDSEHIMQELSDTATKLYRKALSDSNIALENIKESNGEIWMVFTGNTSSTLYSSNNEIHRFNEIYYNMYIDDNLLYCLAYDRVLNTYKYNVLNKNTGNINISYTLSENGSKISSQIGKDYVFYGNKFYKLINNKMVLKFDGGSIFDGNPIASVDVYGNLYLAANGLVKTLKSDSWSELYSVDTRMQSIDVYDQDNIIVSGTNSSYNKIFTTIDNNNDWIGTWAEHEIKFAMENNWVNSTNKFRPDEFITRAEFIKVVNKAYGYTEKATDENFSDVNSNDWWYNEILIALKAGYINSKASSFRPTDNISREEVAAIITTINKNKDSDLDKIKTYIDYSQVSEWALSSVEGAIEAGYMGKGNTTFRPKANITRSESIVTLFRTIK